MSVILPVFDELQQALLLLLLKYWILIEVHKRTVRRKEGVQLVNDRLDVGNARRGGV